MKWIERTFESLTPGEMFGLMRLRSEVFVVEQDCVYLDLDDKDVHSLHLAAFASDYSNGDSANAVVRLVPPGISYHEPSIGRVAIALSERGSGLGVELMERAIRACGRLWPGHGLRISAQEYLIGFYSRLGFEQVGNAYMEDGIPHVQMFRTRMGINEWFDELAQATEEFCSVLRALPNDCMNGTAASWGGAQILEHLIRSESGTWHYLAKKAQAQVSALPGSDADSDERGWKLIRALMSEGRWKDPTPGAALSPDSSVQHDVNGQIQLWLNQRSEAKDMLLSNFDDDAWWTVQVFNHPIAGRISLSDTLGFVGTHIRHHIHQLNRLRSEHSTNPEKSLL